MNGMPLRDDLGRLLPGHTANPGCRPKVVDEIRQLARQHAPTAFKRICELVDSEDEKTSLAASQEILNRAYGKPTQEVQKTVEKMDWTLMYLQATRFVNGNAPAPSVVDGESFEVLTEGDVKEETGETEW